MSINFAETGEGATATALGLHPVATHLTTQVLTNGYEAEALAFLAERPIHTVMVVRFGERSGHPLTRGDFYACRMRQAKLKASP